jgi:hypothetical protein
LWIHAVFKPPELKISHLTLALPICLIRRKN